MICARIELGGSSWLAVVFQPCIPEHTDNLSQMLIVVGRTWALESGAPGATPVQCLTSHMIWDTFLHPLDPQVPQL